MTDWITEKRDGYDARMARNEFVADHYSGEAQRKAENRASTVAKRYRNLLSKAQSAATNEAKQQLRDYAMGNNAQGKYLKRRAQGENILSYEERVQVTRYPMHMASIVDSFVGSIFAIEHKGVDTWTTEEGDGPLGDPAKEGSVASMLIRDIDGTGRSLESAMRSVATTLCIHHRQWYFVDGASDRFPRTRCLFPNDSEVINFLERDGRVVEAILEEGGDGRETLREEPEDVTYYLYVTPEGWERYQVDDDGDPQLISEGEWGSGFYATTERRDGQEIAPIQYVDLGFERDVGWMLAKGNNSLWNLYSDVRAILRTCNYPKLRGDVDDKQWENTMQKQASGYNSVQGDWDYIGPPIDNATGAHQIYQDEAQSYYSESLQQYNDAAKEATATELRQQDQRGRQSFLSLLSDKLDEVENDIRFLASQIEEPNRPDQWRIPHKNRSHDFAPMEPWAEAEAYQDLFFSEDAIPVPGSTLADIITDAVEMLGHDVDRADVQSLAAAQASLRDGQVDNGVRQMINRIQEQANGND